MKLSLIWRLVRDSREWLNRKNQLNALRDIHWLGAVVAIVMAMAMLTFASQGAHASNDFASMSDACRAQMNLADDGHEHGGKTVPAEKSACCIGACVDIAQPALATLIVARIQSHKDLPIVPHIDVQSMTPDSPHRPPRA